MNENHSHQSGIFPFIPQLNQREQLSHNLQLNNTYYPHQQPFQQNNLNNNQLYPHIEDELSQLSQLTQLTQLHNQSNNQTSNQIQNQLYINDDLVKFKKFIKEWISLDDDIRILQSAIKEKKKKQTALTPYITKYLEENDIKHIIDKSGTINYTKSETKKSLSKEYMTTKIAEYIKDVDKSKKLVEYLMDKRETTLKYRLKRQVNKNNISEHSVDLSSI